MARLLPLAAVLATAVALVHAATIIAMSLSRNLS
jgi:hypothetical protein